MPDVIATLDKIRFRGDNGFIIGIFRGDSDNEFGGLGNMLSPQEGLTYKLNGKWSDHPDFGKQFKFNNYLVDKPADTNGIYTYLIRNVSGIGAKIATDLIFEFDTETLDVLINNPELVAAKINGLTLKKALKIQAWLQEEAVDRELMVELMGLLNVPGMRKDLPGKLIQQYGSDAVDQLKRNPYIITQFSGIGFLIADKLAMFQFKINPDSMFRIKAAILYVIKQHESNSGSTWMLKSELANIFYELTGVDADKMADGLFELEIDDAIIDDETGMVAISQTVENEKYVAGKLLELINAT